MQNQSVPRTDPDVNTAAGHPLPEAPVSVNVRLDIAGLCHQVTARGHSGAEAAANLADTLTALRATFKAPPVPDRAAQIAALVACGLRRCVQQGDLPKAQRLLKAEALVLAGAVAPTDCTSVWQVRSQSQNALWHLVTVTTDADGRESYGCTCQWATYHPETACKHSLSVAMWRKLA